VLRPSPDQAYVLPCRDLSEVAHSGARGRLAQDRVGAKADHRELSVITTEKHVLDRAFEDLF
jgi:hypothetical protein